MKNNYLLSGILALVNLLYYLLDVNQNTNATEMMSQFLREKCLLQERAKSGKQQLEDGSTYQGELMKGEPHGYGKRVFKIVITLKVSFKRVEHTAMVPTGLKKMNYLIAM